jgi:hypothetical protein
MPDPSGLYPGPPQPQSGLGAMGPLQILQLVDSAQKLSTDLGTGRALKDAYDPSQPTGINIQKLQQLLVRDPNVARRLPEIMTGVQNLRSATTAADTSATDLGLKRNAAVMDFIGSVSDSVKTKDQLHDALLTHARNNPYIPSGYYTEFFNAAPNEPKALQSWLKQQQNAAMGSAAAASRVSGPPAPSGAPTTVPLGAANIGAAPGAGAGANAGAAAGSGVVTTGLPPGYGEAATAIGGASAQQANALTAANDTSMVRKGMLGNLEDDLTRFTSGPGAEWTKVAKAWVNRNVPLPQGWQFDPKSIASQEAFTKQATQLVQAQFQTIGGTGTDAKFNSAYETSPNDTLSQLGNKGIIRLLKGNEDAIQAKNRAWRQWLKDGNGPQTYPDFSDQFNEKFDPRAFQFKYLSKDERQQYISSMDPEDRERFIAALTHAHNLGWIPFETKKK